jgi:hypothetical protein
MGSGPVGESVSALYMGPQFGNVGTMGPSMTVPPPTLGKRGGYIPQSKRVDTTITKDRLTTPGPGAYGD